jgi:CBS domain-containing protein/sporulation protein YlmC with PRC-barrel domain
MEDRTMIVKENGMKESKPQNGYQFYYMSELIKKPVCIDKTENRIGKLTDLVFALMEPYPEAVGIYIEHGWGKPTTFIPWEKVSSIREDAIIIRPPDNSTYPPFVDQAGWILLDKHLMGRTVVDMDDRRTEVVNDIHLLMSKERLSLVHVDISFAGHLKRWGLGKLKWIKEDIISWKFVQPLSVEDVVATGKVSLSVTKNQLTNLPGEDLADILEELPEEEQQALLLGLDSEKAADALSEAEPRAQRQIIANIRQERARMIFREMSVPQLASLFSVLPYDQVSRFINLLEKEQAERVRAILSERETTASKLASSEFLVMKKDVRVGDALNRVQHSGLEYHNISYLYIVDDDGHKLLGVVDLRELIISDQSEMLADIMTSPVVIAKQDDILEDLAELFAKYHYRMIPVADSVDNILGVILYNDVMINTTTGIKI